MKKLILLVLLLSSFLLNAQTLLPKSPGEIIQKKHYTLSYNETHEQANWVYYELSPLLISGTTKRRNDFREDPQVSTSSATLNDYKGSGYDRGHLCPAAAMNMDAESMSETFYMSNMSPQVPAFNRGIWKNLESTVRSWVFTESRLYVVSGPIFKDVKHTIGDNHVSVPTYYYKAIYDPTDENKMIAFVLPNEASTEPLSSFVVSIDSLEQLTGIDFYPELEDSLENKLEASSDFTKWRSGKKLVSKSYNTVDKSTRIQCIAITKKGNRCKRMSREDGKYCTQHTK